MTKSGKTKAAAIGVRAHSGWAAVVALGNDGGMPTPLARERVSVVEEKMLVKWVPGQPVRGAGQPYHHVMEWKIPAAEKFLAECAAIGVRMARAALRKMADELRERGYRVAGCAVLTGSGRELPELARILAAHPLIHTAEGIFFRRIFQDACEGLGWRVLNMREKELDEQAKLVLGAGASRAKKKISSMGKTMGAPWTGDQKMAGLAAWMVLGGK
jgi:hypothetical protein